MYEFEKHNGMTNVKICAFVVSIAVYKRNDAWFMDHVNLIYILY